MLFALPTTANEIK